MCGEVLGSVLWPVLYIFPEGGKSTNYVSSLSLLGTLHEEQG